MLRLKDKRGFTLVELAIVLVIIGIILGAILKGQELITNAKTKRFYNQYREIVAAIYTYYDRYGNLPGDDNTAQSRWSTTSNGDGDGLIETAISFACTTNSPESCGLWEHLRLANIISGTGPTNPKHVFGGAIGVGYATVQGVSTNWIGFQNVPREIGGTIDTQYDDGDYTSGSIVASGAYTGTGTITLYFRL